VTHRKIDPCETHEYQVVGVASPIAARLAIARQFMIMRSTRSRKNAPATRLDRDFRQAPTAEMMNEQDEARMLMARGAPALRCAG